ncbi:MAG: metallophosphoesterase family protein [Armatimonadetes bacterium]|nr:metallophosphoesterase family protein [Armatimonadota bacterium]
MALRFWSVALAFHVGLILVSIAIGRCWLRRMPGVKRVAQWWGWLIGDACRFGAAALLLAVAAGVFAPWPPGAITRLLCQALFGEAILLAAWIAALHFQCGWRARASLPGLLAILLTLVYVEAYHRCPYDLQVRRHPLDLSGGRADARTLRVLHLSDFQSHVIGAYQERAIRMAAQQRADLIVFTGDYLQGRLDSLSPQVAADFRALLRHEALRAPLGVYAVQGDVDSDWQSLFAGLGVTCLVDDFARVTLPGRRSLVVIGLSAWLSRSRDPAALSRVIDAAPSADLRVVIGHAPDFVDTRAGLRRIDLVLAGHTHGGQVVLPLLGPPLTLSRLPRRFAGGLNSFEGMPLHVSCGIGMERLSAPQIRFLCPPEICILELRY